MARSNTLIFVDMPAEDPAAAGRFYAEVFGWRDDDRPYGLFHRMVPGGTFINPDGTESQIPNLHLGVFKAANARPNPNPNGVNPRHIAQNGRRPRIWILVGDGQNPHDILARAVERGATELWRNHYWSEFNGFVHAFRDPWGNDIMLWVRGGADPKVPSGYTRE